MAEHLSRYPVGLRTILIVDNAFIREELIGLYTQLTGALIEHLEPSG